MICLHEAEHRDLLKARDERDALRVDVALMTTEELLRRSAEALVDACDRAGFVLTVTQWSVPPLAMGQYKTIATIRQARAAS